MVAAAAALVGAGGMVVARRPDVALLSAVVTLTVVMGALSIFSIGLLLLLVGVGLAVVLARRLPGSGPWAVASGVAMAVGLATAAVVAVQPPVVACTPHGTRSSSSIWSGGSVSSGSSARGPDGDATGTVTQGARTYSFTCRNGDLVDFRSTGGD